MNRYPLFDRAPGQGGGMPEASKNTEKKSRTEQNVEEEESETPESGATDPKNIRDVKTTNVVKEQTRGKMAAVFISGFFMVILMCFAYAAWKQATMDEVREMVIAVIGALSGLIGFVIGYYFKTNN